MTNADTRQAIAEAMTDVDGVRGFERQPAASRPGDAWPQWRGSERADGRAYVENWVVVVVLPADVDQADAWIDSHRDAVDEALSGVLYVNSYAPATMPAETGDVFALMITGWTE